MQNEQDLEKLVHAHTAALLRYCTGLLGCEADAQDAVQKTFIKAWQQRHTLRHDRHRQRVRVALPHRLPHLAGYAAGNQTRGGLPHPGAVGARTPASVKSCARR